MDLYYYVDGEVKKRTANLGFIPRKEDYIKLPGDETTYKVSCVIYDVYHNTVEVFLNKI